MTLRRFAFATTIVCGLCVWGLAYSCDSPAPSSEQNSTENVHGNGNHDEALQRYRSGQSNHWRHVMVGNYASSR
jgi:hypothetical protein